MNKAINGWSPMQDLLAPLATPDYSFGEVTDYDPSKWANFKFDWGNAPAVNPVATNALAGADMASQFDGGIFSMDALLGKTFADGSRMNGWGMPALQGLGALGSAWLGMQQLNLGKEQLAFQKDAFNRNFENQKRLTNSRLRDRQAARLGANPNGYQSVGDYMRENGV